MVAKKSTEKISRETVLAYIKALNEQNYSVARDYVTDNFSFKSPVMSIDSPEEYFKQMTQLRIKYDVKKIFVDNEDVCLFYDFIAGNVTRFGCGWYHLDNGKINSLRIITDIPPNPESSGKK